MIGLDFIIVPNLKQNHKITACKCDFFSKILEK